MIYQRFRTSESSSFYFNILSHQEYINIFKEKGENNKYYIDISFINSKVGTSVKIDTSSSIKINTSEDITSIKNDTRGSIKNDTLKVLNISNKKATGCRT